MIKNIKNIEKGGMLMAIDSSLFYTLFISSMGIGTIFLFILGMVGLSLLLFVVLFGIESYNSTKIEKLHDMGRIINK